MNIGKEATNRRARLADHYKQALRSSVSMDENEERDRDASERVKSSPQDVHASDREALFPREVEDEDSRTGTSDLPSASLNVLNSIIGAGIIGLPYALKQAGFPLGLLLLVVVAYVTDYSIILLIKSGSLSGTTTYQSLVHSAFGYFGYIVLSLLQFTYPFIAMVSYNVITGDTLTKVFERIPGVGEEHILANRYFIIFLTSVFCTLPLSLFRDVAQLGKVSLISVFFTLFILIVVVVRAFTLGPQIPASMNAWTFAQPNVVQAVGIMAFAFICHHNTFIIYGSLEQPSLSNWSRVTHVSVLSALIISLILAACGYATFTGFTQGDIFENYCKNDDLVTAGRFCYALSILLTFPIECFVTREVFENVFFASAPWSRVRHTIVTVVIVAAATAASVSTDCLGIVLELNGVLCASPLVFILPAACYLRLSSEPWYNPNRLLSAVLLLCGMAIMGVGLVMALLHQQTCTHGQEMFYCSSLNATTLHGHNATFPSSTVAGLWT
ncbi:putative sodium-coupled neutral amino acid transporter 11 isoform X1 [Petromyzon marinus]|uniref:Putative sodium-coupled neutral amino acid transporter 11 n=2 Tax=Petromyzon marinus TaxID=7757 RepID=A0AAJ7WMJ7_PETMA|nr:putative sodium-coupled neutral amino acid transporter 11 isoform X1 [Petromyzon marinus]